MALALDTVSPDVEASPRRSRLLLAAAVLALVVGAGLVAGGVFGAVVTWSEASAQKIVTPDDAAIPGVPVRGPVSMWVQADVITRHQLARTGGLYYAEMPQRVPQLDEAGLPVLGGDGEPVLVSNPERASWVTATTLVSALQLGVLAYGLSATAFAVGVTLVVVGLVFLRVRSRAVLI